MAPQPDTTNSKPSMDRPYTGLLAMNGSFGDMFWKSCDTWQYLSIASNCGSGTDNEANKLIDQQSGEDMEKDKQDQKQA
ncbi:hypothetical protein PV08_05389 [Exophiala spinifera]|uniref:Uncharacterized protein n=1 Tax=Exophiala spinifera TaxID=91928 RepID=A0A0D2B8T9_9EURO|nr:uncharacterized protein PV08_05389 [Exophiala spinifera]KIW15343.1 hypothetical protein PV08_05389 [Exophiala spinifera]